MALNATVTTAPETLLDPAIGVVSRGKMLLQYIYFSY